MIKMIIKGRDAAMKHVSRTHRVALDSLFDPINLDPLIQVRCVDPRSPLAEIMPEGHGDNDRWDRLLRLSFIMDVPVFSCSIFYLALTKTSELTKAGACQKRHMQAVKPVEGPGSGSCPFRNSLSRGCWKSSVQEGSFRGALGDKLQKVVQDKNRTDKSR